MYAAQFFEAAQRDLGDLSAPFARGEFRPLLDWLRKNIHSRGKQLRAGPLVQRVTGQPLSHRALLTHLHGKCDPLYGLD
jgi:carboxypeptidase Taq